MAKRLCTIIIIALIFVSTGCQQVNTGISMAVPDRNTISTYTAATASTQAQEIDIIERVESSRTEYRHSLETLISYYNRTGNNQKLDLAQKELASLNSMTQYYYIDPITLPNNYSPTTQIADADFLYKEAMDQKQQAEKYTRAFVDKDMYRTALYKFRQLIKNYPNSDKIDDAAYFIGEISEYFKDYSIALSYYKVAYQWDEYTPHPARFRAARILDKQMHNYAEALQLYHEAIKTEGQHDENRGWKANAEERISIIEKSM